MFQKLNLIIAQVQNADKYKVDLSPLPVVDATPARVQIMFAIVFTVIGALSLLMFTIGGLRYVASQGDPQATAKAKGTIIYATVGIIVSMLAVTIVTFVLGAV